MNLFYTIIILTYNYTLKLFLEKRLSVTKITTVSPIVTSGSSSGTIMCPGIFDCTLMCMSGYKIDSQGCPLCKCLSGSQT